MTHLDLFSGIGGFALAARWAGFETIGFCEIEDYPRKVLQKNFPGIPIHYDIKKLNGGEYEGVDLITGGYPCQPFSTAGKRKGEQDDRHLWPEMLRVITQARPTWVVAENVIGHVSMGVDTVLTDLESKGYSARPIIIPACAVNAYHRRDRVWILAANTEHVRSTEQEREHQRPKVVDGGIKNGLVAGETLVNTSTTRSQKRETIARTESEAGSTLERQAAERAGWWSTEPGVGRVANGVSNRVDRIKGLGNAIVPQVAYQILCCIHNGR